MSRKSLWRAISSGNRLKKFFSSDFLKQSAEKVFGERFPEEMGRKSLWRAIS